ncbi:MAG: hypothetical protein ACJ76B_06155 [Solirubrobacterales bacterium]
MTDLRVVGVHPGAELSERPRLFAALSKAFPGVVFEAREAGAFAGLDALVELGGSTEASAAAGAGVPALAALGPEDREGAAVSFEITRAEAADRRLRGRAFPDRHLPLDQEPLGIPDAETIASFAGGSLWARRGALDVAALAPAELADGESLRCRLCGTRSLALLPLVALLRSLHADSGWRPPPLRATFLLDDPNLHWPSYGYLSLPETAEHADRHGYHLALAMVPLDARLNHRGAVSLLRRSRSLSLLVHGNDHFGGELGRGVSREEALAVAAQALRRVAAFEHRTGVKVSRVMVPPHEACSEPMARALVRTGFDAITMTRPYPWEETTPSWLAHAPSAESPVGWWPADAAPGLPPVLLRHPVAPPLYSLAEVALRAYLDQPLILYGHHDDLRDGLDLLAERALEIESLGEARWASTAEIAASNFSSRADGEQLRLRPYSRRLSVEVPAGISTLVVEPAGTGSDEEVLLGHRRFGIGEPIPISGQERVELALRSLDAVSPGQVAPPPREIRRLVRRLAGEAHDRMTPAFARLPGRS